MSVTLAGTEVYRGSAVVNVRQSAATGLGAIVWGLWNPSSLRTIVPTRLFLRCFFDGTAAATLMRYEVVKGTAVTAFSAGASVSPVHKKTGLSSAQLGQVRVLDTGLTATGFTLQGVLANITMGRVTQTTTNYQESKLEIDWPSIQLGQIELAVNEMLAIRQVVNSVIGDNIIGHCEFTEKAA